MTCIILPKWFNKFCNMFIQRILNLVWGRGKKLLMFVYLKCIKGNKGFRHVETTKALPLHPTLLKQSKKKSDRMSQGVCSLHAWLTTLFCVKSRTVPIIWAARSTVSRIKYCRTQATKKKKKTQASLVLNFSSTKQIALIHIALI